HDAIRIIAPGGAGANRRERPCIQLESTFSGAVSHAPSLLRAAFTTHTLRPVDRALRIVRGRYRGRARADEPALAHGRHAADEPRAAVRRRTALRSPRRARSGRDALCSGLLHGI